MEYEHIPLKLDGCKIVLTNTNVKHSRGGSKYNDRRNECEEGLSALKSAMPEIKQLADVSPEEFELHKELITNSTVQKRIEHVVYACDRVKKSAETLENNEIAEFEN